MGKHIQLKASDGFALDAYVAEPADRPRGAIIVAQEIFGVNSHIRGVADGYAADGYVAIAPALFDRAQRGFECGYTPPEVETGKSLMQKLDWDDAMRDVEAALAQAKAAGKVGIVGYCWGGVVAWLAAARVAGLAAASCYYGGAIPRFIDERPKCPLMLHFGEKDQSIPLEKAREIATRHPEATTYFYPAGHGFNCDQRASFDAAASKLARERTLAFFRRHVG